MPQHGWHNCPAPIRTQVNTLIAASRELIGNNLIGIYLHGSLASGCHNPNRSDIDLLVVVERGLSVETKRALAELLLRLDGQPRQLELSVLTWAQLHPWQYPTPFDFHNGNWIAADLASGAWRHWNDSTLTDPDLAAHITIVNYCGICLAGRPISEVFLPVPAEHYRASILQDFDWALERIGQRPLYFELNACRIAAFLQEGLLLSKDEGGEWGLRHAPQGAQAVIEGALHVYRGLLQDSDLKIAGLWPFLVWIIPLVPTSKTYQVVVALVRPADKLLLVKQQGPSDAFAFWALPGGVIEANETPARALVREVREETGLTIPNNCVGELVYSLLTIEAGSKSLVWVFEVMDVSGEFLLADPDGLVSDAQFIESDEAIEKISNIPYRSIRDPLLAYLQGNAAHGTFWLYRQTPPGSELTSFPP